MRFYLGPWVRNRAVTWAKRWSPPAGAVWSFDYSSKRHSFGNQDREGVGLFMVPNNVFLSSDYREVVTGDWSSPPSEGNRIIYAQQIGLTGANRPQGSTLEEWFLSSLIIHGDVDGELTAKPLMPGRGVYTSHLGLKTSVVPFDINSPSATKQIAMWQKEYLEIKAQADSGVIPDPEFHRRWLSKMGEVWNKTNPQDIFVPEGHPKPTPIPHRTSYSETFNKADGSLGPVLTWTEYTGTGLAVASNQLVNLDSSFADNKARAEHSTSSSDQFAEITAVNVNEEEFQVWQVLARHNSSTPESYAFGTLYILSVPRWDNEIYRWDGSENEFGPLGSSSTTVTGDGAVVRFEVSGSSLVGKIDAVTEASATDTNIASGLRAAVRSVKDTGTTWTMDSFSFGDLVESTGTGNILLLGVG